MASSGSSSGSSSSASPRRTTRPIVVPSSSITPSGRRSATSPPTRTTRPISVGRSMRSASGAPAAVVEPPLPDVGSCSVPASRPDRQRAPSGRRSRRPRGGGRLAIGAGSRIAGRSRSGTAAGRSRRRWPSGPRPGRLLAIPDPGWPTIGTCRVPIVSSARQRSPSLVMLARRPVTVTSRHSWAAFGGACRTMAGGTALVIEPIEALGPEPGRTVGLAHPAVRADPGTDRRDVRSDGQQQLDRGAGVLDHDPATGRVEQRGRARSPPPRWSRPRRSARAPVRSSRLGRPRTASPTRSEVPGLGERTTAVPPATRSAGSRRQIR